MSEKQYPVITISREFCAYGRTVAKALSDELGIPFYDRDFVKKTVEESGYAEEDVQKEGESMSSGSKFMNTFLNGAMSYRSSYDAIFAAQKTVILNLSKSPCIIVGRCANSILQKAEIPSFDIFLYADMQHRMQRAKELGYEKEDKNLERLVSKYDKRRRVYYREYTGTEMGDCANYNICLDTGTIGPEKSAQILADLIRSL